MKITDLIIDPKSLGSKLWLVEVSPAYEYQNNRRTDTVLGYRYTVALPEKGLDKINVRIDGEKRMDNPDGYVEVRFDGLEVFIYWSQGQPRWGPGCGYPSGESESLMTWAALERPAGIRTVPSREWPPAAAPAPPSHKGQYYPLWETCSM